MKATANTTNTATVRVTRTGKLAGIKFLQAYIDGKFVSVDTGEEFNNWQDYCHLPVDTPVYNFDRLEQAVENVYKEAGYEASFQIFCVQWIDANGHKGQINFCPLRNPETGKSWMEYSTIQEGWNDSWKSFDPLTRNSN